ncbi:MAG: hypothetical protein OEV42_02685 [Deltaproteobacteria bacterium]|nr:hypothetical protein [Deltaproteobacteria bacterium]
MVSKHVRPAYWAMLLFSITAGLYYRSLSEVFGVLTIDDGTLMQHLANHRMQFNEVFHSAWQKKYYRPLVDFSYLVDQRLWGSDPSGFRTTNVLIHALNVVFFYFMARMLLKFKNGRNEISLFAAILFGVHPVAVESASWISGRSDSLATLWSLIALLLYFLAKDRHRLYIIPAFLFCIPAILSKEVAIAVPLLVGMFEIFYCESFGYERSKYSIAGIAFILFSIPLFILFRNIVISGEDMGIGLILGGITEGNLISVVSTGLASIGFYVKKFIFPFPLNMMIFEINLNLYAILGVIIILCLTYLINIDEAKNYCFLFIWALIGIAPAVLISFTNIAWTPWAERYLYFSLVPLSLVCGLLFAKLYNSKWSITSKVLLFVIICLFMLSSYNRSLEMNSNELIWKDSYIKSPTFIGAAVGYAGTLAGNNKPEEAEVVLNKAIKLEGAKHFLFHRLGHISCEKGDLDEAERFYRKALLEARKDKLLVTVGAAVRRDILISLSDINLKRAGTAADKDEKEAYYLAGIKGLIEAYNEKKLNILNYRIAKVYIVMGKDNKAAEFLKKFIRSGQNKLYQGAAKRMLEKINLKGALPAR